MDGEDWEPEYSGERLTHYADASWLTKDKKRLSWEEMETSHLERVKAYLQRKGETIPVLLLVELRLRRVSIVPSCVHVVVSKFTGTLKSHYTPTYRCVECGEILYGLNITNRVVQEEE